MCPRYHYDHENDASEIPRGSPDKGVMVAGQSGEFWTGLSPSLGRHGIEDQIGVPLKPLILASCNTRLGQAFRNGNRVHLQG